VDVLMAGTSRAATELPGLGRELLEGMDIEGSPGFAAWLLGERRRLQALSEAVLREGALRSLASGNAATAVELATRLVAADPLDEDAHILLIRAFREPATRPPSNASSRRGSSSSAGELGVEPGPELAEAARIQANRSAVGGAGGRAALLALLESGDAAVSAGAIDVGLEKLRGAVAGTRELGETDWGSASRTRTSTT
jgi:DNA-binding SARP family transcriptional activator